MKRKTFIKDGLVVIPEKAFEKDVAIAIVRTLIENRIAFKMGNIILRPSN